MRFALLVAMAMAMAALAAAVRGARQPDAVPFLTTQPRGGLAGETVLVTGASSGIGYAAALHLGVYAGANIVAAARRKEKLNALVAAIEAGGGTAMAVSCDVTKRADIDAAFAAAVERFGGVQHVFSNAGVAAPGHGGELADDAEAERIFNVNYHGARRMLDAALAEFKRNGAKRTTFVINSSLASLCDHPVYGAFATAFGGKIGAWVNYMASKAAVDALVRTAVVLASNVPGVRVHGINEVFYKTAMSLEMGKTDDGLEQVAGLNPIFSGIPGAGHAFGPMLHRLMGADSPLPNGAAIASDGNIAFPMDHFFERLGERAPTSTDVRSYVKTETLRDSDLEPLNWTDAQREQHVAAVRAYYSADRARYYVNPDIAAMGSQGHGEL